MIDVPEFGNRGGIWRPAPPATAAEINKLRARVPTGLPESYFELLLGSNGGEGDLGVEPGWFCPWPADEVLSLNQGYSISEVAPGLFGFGSSGGGELLAFDMRHPVEWPIVMVPFIPLSLDEAITISDNFDDFSAFVGRLLTGTVV